MIYEGHVEKGVVLLDEPAGLPDGTRVQVTVTAISDDSAQEPCPTLFERLAPIIGIAEGLPEDAAENHDHYLYGLPKK